MVDDKIDFVRSLTKSNNSGTKLHVESSRHKTKNFLKSRDGVGVVKEKCEKKIVSLFTYLSLTQLLSNTA